MVEARALANVAVDLPGDPLLLGEAPPGEDDDPRPGEPRPDPVSTSRPAMSGQPEVEHDHVRGERPPASRRPRRRRRPRRPPRNRRGDAARCAASGARPRRRRRGGPDGHDRSLSFRWRPHTTVAGRGAASRCVAVPRSGRVAYEEEPCYGEGSGRVREPSGRTMTNAPAGRPRWRRVVERVAALRTGQLAHDEEPESGAALVPTGGEPVEQAGLHPERDPGTWSVDPISTPRTCGGAHPERRGTVLQGVGRAGCPAPGPAGPGRRGPRVPGGTSSGSRRRAA